MTSKDKDIRQTLWYVELAIVVATLLFMARNYGRGYAFRYLLGLLGALAVQRVFIVSMRHKIGSELSSLADLLTVCRASTGSVLAGLAVSGVRDRSGAAGRMGWIMALLAATLCDWLDGPLARKIGPTRLGGVIDIEADSWLTLWCAVGAVAWGDAPSICLIPPLLRYLDPLLDLRRGKLPRGGGPWRSRVTGVAQMVSLLSALMPFEGCWRKRLLSLLAVPITVSQSITIVTLFLQKLSKPAR